MTFIEKWNGMMTDPKNHFMRRDNEENTFDVRLLSGSSMNDFLIVEKVLLKQRIPEIHVDTRHDHKMMIHTIKF